MRTTPRHVKWLVDTGERLQTADGKTVQVLELVHLADEAILSEWATHFRNHYCLDKEIDYFRSGYRYSRGEYLNKIKFPDAKKSPGPSIRAGDFGEILVADYLEYIQGFWVPRARYGAKIIGNESSKGCDTIGFFFAEEDYYSPSDIMAVYEAKARLTSDHLADEKKQSGFQSAISDSAKDNIRIAASLNYLKQRLFDKGRLVEADKVERFQQPHDRPYIQISGAAAIISNHCYIPETISLATTNGHPNNHNLVLLIIRGEQLMELVHTLYQKAANEA